MLLAQIDRTQLYSLVPFVVYLLGVFVIAIVSARYLKGRKFESEYYVGSRSFGPWVLAMSWVATMASGGSFLGTSWGHRYSHSCCHFHHFGLVRTGAGANSPLPPALCKRLGVP